MERIDANDLYASNGEASISCVCLQTSNRFPFGWKKGGSVVHSAPTLGFVMQRLYSLKFALCLCA